MTVWRNYIRYLFSVVPLFSWHVKAQPSFGSSFIVKDQQIFRDIKNSNLYYFMPFDYLLVKDKDGKPSFSLTQMRYTGTKTAGDEGKIKHSNILQFKIANDETQHRQVPSIRAILKTMNPAAVLQMLPVKKFFSVLVFASSDHVSPDSDSALVRKIDMADATGDQSSVSNSFWNERVISLRLNDHDAQLVYSALMNKQSVMSFSYAIYTVLTEKVNMDITVSGIGKLRKEVSDLFKLQAKPGKDTLQHLALVKADAISLAVDVDKWPALIQKVDINERIPARYAMFDVYCYDFNNELRPDLYEKKVEIRATSVSGNEITTAHTFKSVQPDKYAAGVRFMYAIRLDIPYYYRITEIDNAGETVTTEWLEKKEWYEILDITTPPEKRLIKSNQLEQ